MPLFRHVCQGTYETGETWSFTLHTNSTNDLATAQSRWVTATGVMWTGEMDALVSNQVSMTELTTASITTATGQQISRVSTTVARPGVSTDESLPAQCATVVSLTSETATRAGRGRFYLPPLAVTVMNTGRLSAASMTALVAAVDSLFSSLGSGTPLDPVLYSRTAHTLTNITGGNIGNVIDTQRRRRNKLIEVRTALTLS